MTKKQTATISSLAMLMGVLAVLAQASSVIAQTPPAGANPVTQGLRQNWDGAKLNIKESADLMEEANYGFKPVDSVRTFGDNRLDSGEWRTAGAAPGPIASRRASS